jgi:hypothetical protein
MPFPLEPRARKKSDRARAPQPPLDDIDWAALPSNDEGERLRTARRALEAGDHRRVRELTTALAGAESELVRESARKLARRISVDPAQLIILGLCATFFLAMVLLYLR